MADAALLRERAKYANRIGMEREFDDLSFGAAFNKAKREGRRDFPWRGETYSTETQEERTQKAYSDTSRRRDVAPTPAPSPSPSAAPTLRSLLGTTAPEAKEDALTRIAKRQPTKRPEQERDEARDRAIAALSLMGGLGTNVGLRALAGRMRAGQPAPAPRSPLVRDDDIIPAFKKGGSVKSGGSVKGSGCERRGLRKCKVY
jgi:hypothetical protein